MGRAERRQAMKRAMGSTTKAGKAHLASQAASRDALRVAAAGWARLSRAGGPGTQPYTHVDTVVCENADGMPILVEVSVQVSPVRSQYRKA